MTLKVRRDTSFTSTIKTYLHHELTTTGRAVLQIEELSEKLETDMLAIATLAGPVFGVRNMGYHTLEIDSSLERLALHTEGISNAEGVIPCFALGCLLPSEDGGETRIFDGQSAALAIQQEPSLRDVEIEYSALANPGISMRHPLVVPEFGGVVRYRSRVLTNKVIRLGSTSEDEMYARVDEILEKHLLVSHRWSTGELLFVNNLITLHDRLPFSGRRRMLRVRYDDNLNARIRY